MNAGLAWEIFLAALHLVGVGGVALRVIWVRRPAGSAFAWLLLVALVPYAGVVLYLLFGERPIGRERLRRAHAFYAAFPELATSLWLPDTADLHALSPQLRGIARLARKAAGLPVLDGSTLAVGPLGFVFQRADLRMHRKIVVVDQRIAYTGSMNLVDPRFFKQDAGVGEWVDAMVRVAGPAVAGLRAVFLFDWKLQTGEGYVPSSDAAYAARRAVGGASRVQVVPSGPGVEGAANLRILVDAIAIARERVVLTTPYFVPDASLALALQNAAMRGVEVTIILPAVNDSTLVTYASRAFFDELLAAGARVLKFDAGLLHTKSVTIDDEFALFGTVNLDMRSLHLNFELMLAVYDAGFNAQLLALQRGYERDARAIDAEAWHARPARERLLEGLASLVAPML